MATVKKKTYDHLNHRCHEFDLDFSDFLSQVESIREGIQGLVEQYFSRNITVRLRARRMTLS